MTAFTILAPCAYGWTANLGQRDAADNIWLSEADAQAVARELQACCGWHGLRVVAVEQLDNIDGLIA
jgi:hypothetical protein